MKRPLLLRRRRAADPVPGAEPPAFPEPAAAPLAPETGERPVAAPSPDAAVAMASQTTAVHTPVAVEDPSAPAGLEPQEAGVPGEPSFRERGRLRRRLRYLRRVRELGFRDLGGLVFDLHRFGREGSALVAGKLDALQTVDAELRALEVALDDRRDTTVLREPGIAACPRCAALHGSDARFCPSCGLDLAGPQAMSEVGGAPTSEASLPSTASTAEHQSTTVQPAIGAGQPPEVVAERPTTAQPAVGTEQPTTAQPAILAWEPGAEPSPAAPER